MNSGEETPPGGASSGKVGKTKTGKGARAKGALKSKAVKAAAKKAAAPKKPAATKKAAAPKEPKAAVRQPPKHADSVAGLRVDADAQRRAEQNGPLALRPVRGPKGAGLTGAHALLHELGETLREMTGQAKTPRYVEWERKLGVK